MTDDLLTMLYKEKAPIIKKYLIKNGCQPVEAEDIVQNTFVKAIEYMVELHQKNLSAWLFKVSLHSYYDLCRKNNRYPSISVDDDDQFLDLLIHEFHGETFMLKKEKQAEVTSILNKLTPSQKNLLQLRYDMELSYSEMAEITDMDEKTIKTYLYRARLSFKRKWEEMNNE